MTFSKDASHVLRYAWSVRWMAVAVLFSIAEVTLPIFFYQIPQGLFAVLSAIATGGGFVTRLMAQKEFAE